MVKCLLVIRHVIFEPVEITFFRRKGQDYKGNLCTGCDPFITLKQSSFSTHNPQLLKPNMLKFILKQSNIL